MLADGRWFDLTGALLAAGSRTGRIRYLNTVGRGERVYVTDFMMVHSGGRSFFLRIRNGSPEVEAAPHTCDAPFLFSGVRDRQGALWLPGSIRGGGGTCDWISGQLAIRLHDGGALQEFQNMGWALLCDGGGAVWLGSIRGEDPSAFRLWQHGGVSPPFRVPYADGATPLFSDGPGAAWAWTAAGLVRLHADAASGTVRQGETFAVGDMADPPRDGAWSPRGFLVFTRDCAGPGPRRRALAVVRIDETTTAPPVRTTGTAAD